MEKKSKNISLKFLLISISIGIWILVFQNAGIIPTSQNVKVTNEVDAYVRGKVGIDGSVDIDNTVDVNIHEINGYNQVTTV
jgi:hypothetical protein